MKIKWYGHSSFLITSKDGTKIIIDPYEPKGYDGAIGYAPINDIADIALASHDHADHGYVQGLKGTPQVINKDGETKAKNITFKGVQAFHDTEKGTQRGAILIFRFEVDGISVCHLGDLGEPLSDKQVGELKPVDILLIPVGGFFTIDSEVVTQTIEKLKPAITIPMHYKTSKCGFPLAYVDEFLKDKKKVRKAGTSEIELSKASLPSSPEIVILEHAL
ncbi:MAG: hypothetical protein A3C43_00355 [Candidatus Schekmanbacteria bacterium RIFCSPHIGHO2_02_FULL_38_11]|uniref:MBL fold metallo-hydrolase n=1 Tax=Candidatus Schekmanbacteria bacterium RIFCSPLOWO2_12_FULL_38_15 TaxID=1817883 RepID=A0A1F7SF77_9BACT|nr:MAG: hypothetical protein A2043_01850 [Candidatus Schekmanbacteria bacterium GWA2_38_9]OGL48368.1 MAG: hypothetical protein A3H37_05190 [Candidatus Schekmanbacteria bacterium RIFCSPLOWO2_02_FULL_38_14]OGL51894.1 MAG: hypothetical protein A3G31_05795 [Candidatus Schekmanbacteria bacterium RIFCSPLOWO2_12_FULL_38_15]OGL51963.1 MAG: hypothetical protein A3C43_00355 [Candidatus Schekmanbacteria bacterium RIFCSPHIGHO2_02_FULL_38_11]